MINIQSSPYPLVYKVAVVDRRQPETDLNAACISLRTHARALEGMQKEAIVENPANGSRWRMVCDEGPYLNGTDLAPFPLGFFAAGLSASFISEFVAEAERRDIRIDTLALTLDSLYEMHGSILRGTMAAGAKSVDVFFTVSGNASSEAMLDVAETAVLVRSPAAACLRGELAGIFAIDRNGEALAPRGQAEMPVAMTDPGVGFDELQPASDAPTVADIITRAEEDASWLAGVQDAVGLQASQNRSVHVRSDAYLTDDGIKAITVRCLQPVSTAFTFLSDDSKAVGGQERAPSGLAYLSGGVAFCFMTQLGRYAQIAKQRLHGYGISQQTGFSLERKSEASAEPVRTLVYVSTDEDEQATQKMVAIGEQTCYLHTSYRQAIQIRVSCTN